MPAIIPLTLALPEVDVSDIQNGGYFKPAALPGDSLESLNGGLDSDNYAGTELPGWVFRYGTHCAAGSWGSNRREHVTRRQGGGNDSDKDNQRVMHAGIGARFFLPWEARMLLWGFSGWCCQDATKWNVAAPGPFLEHWDWKVFLDDAEIAAMYGRAPPSRISTDQPDAIPLLDNPGAAYENRWRFASEFGAEKFVAAGYHKVHLSTWGAIWSPDQLDVKLTMPAWSMWVLAIR